LADARNVHPTAARLALENEDSRAFDGFDLGTRPEQAQLVDDQIKERLYRAPRTLPLAAAVGFAPVEAPDEVLIGESGHVDPLGLRGQIHDGIGELIHRGRFCNYYLELFLI